MSINIKIFYFLGLAIVFFSDRMFIQIPFGQETPMILNYQRFIWAFAFLFSFLFINHMSNFMRGWFVLLTILLILLILNSLIEYGHPVKYPRVFSKVFQVYSIFFVYGFYKKFKGKISVDNLVYLISFGFILNVLIVNRDILSVSSFANHERGLTADSVYFLMIPCIFYFNKYFAEKKITYMYLFLLTMFFIIFLQHRTVWVCTALGLIVNILLMHKNNLKITFNSAIPIAMIVVVVGFLASFFILKNETILNKLSENVDDILNPTSQGTGNWRWVQFTSYWPYIVDNFTFGMRLEGFELPVQFFDRDTLAFEDGTGHHFHSQYVDLLFYFGIVGTGVVFIPSIFYVVKYLLSLEKLNLDQLVIISFISTSILFGLSYKWTINVYAALGLAFYFLEYVDAAKTKEDSKKPQLQIAR